MKKRSHICITPFDEMVTDDFLQMIKIAIPYLPSEFQKMAGIYVKMSECNYVLSRPWNINNKEQTPTSLFDEIQPYLPTESQKMISEFKQFMEMLDLLQQMDLESMNMEDITTMLQSERMDENERVDESSGSCKTRSSEAGVDSNSCKAD